MMPMSTLSRSKALIWTAVLYLACGASQAQTTNNPLLGGWSGGSVDGSMAGTDVYNPDGTVVSTARVSVEPGITMLVRSFSRYRYRQVGPNQIEVDLQMVSYLPRQMCVVGSGGTSCQPFTFPDRPNSMTITFLDQNTIQANGMISHRDYFSGLGQIQVPEVAMLQGADGGGGGAVSTCALGTTICDPSGWRKTCERWPAGYDDWKYHGVRCRNGYNQPEF